MRLIAVFAVAIAGMTGSAGAADTCAVPPALIASDSDLTRVMHEIKDKHRLDISVVGTGSSTLPGTDGPGFAYPARLQDALRRHLPGNDINVVAHVHLRQTTAEMAAGMKGVLDADKPALVVWQAGTFDAVRGIEPEEFSTSLAAGIESIVAAGVDVDLLNMQYSPRTEGLLNVSAYDNVMRWMAQERGTLLFDRLAIMRYWNDQGVFDLYTATRKSDMARRVHDCIGRTLAFQIIEAAHLKP
ncbi:MAG: SGNH/GDSL hydrolase family protein [Xanthobacteraceae bacterium]